MILKELRKSREMSQSELAGLIGVSRSTVSMWEIGASQPDNELLVKIADIFRVSVDYLLGRTDDPIDYDTDGDALAEIPLSYVEAANGDMKKARAIMLAAERDAQQEAQRYSGNLRRFSRQDAELIFALWGDAKDIDEKDLEDVKRFAAFIKEKKQSK